LKKQAATNAILEKNQVTISTNISNLNISLQKISRDVEKQYDNIKRLESLIIQKLNPLLDKNQITDELRTKLHNSEKTVNQLRSTILQMTTAIKQMQKREKDEKKYEIKPSSKRQRKQNES
jgi:Mg2+ and Co2+ transporter CorA